MNRKVIKIVSILVMLLMVVTMFSTSVLADSTVSDPLDITQFKNHTDGSGASTSITSIIGSIISIVQVIGVGVAIIMLIVLAIKYISAAPNEKAEIKKTVTIYVVGAIVLFAASGILGIIKAFAETNISDKTSSSTTSIVEVVDVDEYLA